ncbi:MAG: LicD family protein [Lachnospiraceae bacterium]|nr:LicD family protein [Lachnospiraceae bacterium]
MDIPEEFLESEVREGFYIPAFMKRSWAATLDVLNEIAAICTRHGLNWWMDWGTLLATVRHHGFIPWDDDLDISMMREDYTRFLEYAKDELPDGYYANNIYNNPRFDEYHTRLLNCRDIDKSDSFLNRSHGFPYLAGVDIFCIDYVNPDKEEDERLKSLIFNMGSIATSLEPELRIKDVPQYRGVLNDIEAICGHHFDEEGPARQQINILCDRLMQSTTEKEAALATCMVLYTGREVFKGVFPKEYYREFVYMPYEFFEVPVPVHYDEILTTLFGNYMKPYRAGGLHDYPYYSKQEEKLLEMSGEILRKMYHYS